MAQCLLVQLHIAEEQLHLDPQVKLSLILPTWGKLLQGRCNEMLFKQIMYGHLLGMIIVPVVISTDPRSGQEKR
jgi:hypothetical protein